MLTHVQRIRVYALGLIVAVILGAIILNLLARQKLSDVRVLSEVRSLANAVEQFKENYWQYPAGEHIDLRKSIVLSENGFAPGEKVYYQGGIPSSKPVTYLGAGDGYSIIFTLHRTWPEQGISSRNCTMDENAVLSCSKKDE